MINKSVLPLAVLGLLVSSSLPSVAVANDLSDGATGTTQKSVEKKKPREKGKRPPKKDSIQLKVPSMSESIESEACSNIRNSITSSGLEGVTVTCDNTYAFVQSDTYPDHSLMNGITGTNEQLPVPAEGYAAPILLNPTVSNSKTTIDAALGVAVNGVPIYDYSAQGELDVHGYDATKDTFVLGQLDECGGHAGRGDDYHYHAKPTCMIEKMDNVTDATIIGWGYDGFPLYADANPDGTPIPDGALDVCNGQEDEKFGYRYHTSVEAPYIIQCLVGKVDTAVLPRVAPLKGDDARADLRPPRGSVENLQHVELEDGTRSLTYTYNGEEYYTKFKPSATDAKCYDFQQRTISNGGAQESGTYCR